MLCRYQYFICLRTGSPQRWLLLLQTTFYTFCTSTATLAGNQQLRIQALSHNQELQGQECQSNNTYDEITFWSGDAYVIFISDRHELPQSFFSVHLHLKADLPRQY